MDLGKTRSTYPICAFKNSEGAVIESVIPFNSDIKFNLQIRDMDPSATTPTNKAQNVTVFMKGAPERILSRCSKILIDGNEVDFDDDYRGLVNFANDSFGKMGERVLAFAKCELDPALFPKDYKFDMKDWKEWYNDKKVDQTTVPGWFPMMKLTLVGVVSLNDPPRVGVA
jgi:magnesium-transporting ATPase (P-type)